MPANLDRLIAQTLALPPELLGSYFDHLAGRPEVSEAGWRIAERRLSPRPHAQRDEEWTRLHDQEGLSYLDIALASHVARDTVARAVQRQRQRGDSESLFTAEGRYAG